MTAEASTNAGLFESGTHVLVIGLGLSGFAAVKFFNTFGFKVSVSESAPREKINPEYIQWLVDRNIQLETGGHSTDLAVSVDCILVSPGIPLDIEALEAARQKRVPIMGELAVAARFLKTPVLAITGTNGKTTVTTLLGTILRSCGKRVFVGGNIGTPVFDYLAGPQDADIAVIETSSFQLDSAGGVNGFRPDIALLLNITPDHLDRYGSFSEYAASKFKIFMAQKPTDVAILNGDDPEIMKRSHLWPKSRCFFFGEKRNSHSGAYLRDKTVVLPPDTSPDHNEEFYDLSDTGLNEDPNLTNAMAAILAARIIGCSEEGINKGVRVFSPLPHRLTQVIEMDGIQYYDDSKATNIGAVYSALKAMNRKVVLIAGGRDKGAEYDMLKDMIREKVKALILIGEAQEKMAKSFHTLTRIETADNLQAAVQLAAQIATSGEAVLLSPACSSFDMFSGYAERGRVFRETVMSMKNNLAASLPLDKKEKPKIRQPDTC